SAYVSCRLSRKFATMPDRIIEAGQAKPAQTQAGTNPWIGAPGIGQGAMMAANAVSVGSHDKPHVKTALAGSTEGITEGAKKIMIAIKTVLTLLRNFIVSPP